jgi:site-specific DNA recombinase
MTTAAIYARKSNRKPQRDRADDELSVPLQVATARAFAAARGWTVDTSAVFTDDGVSGAEFARRPGLVRLLAALEPGPPFEMLLVTDRDRLGREQVESAFLLKRLLQSGVHVFE